MVLKRFWCSYVRKWEATALQLAFQGVYLAKLYEESGLDWEWQRRSHKLLRLLTDAVVLDE